MESNEIIYKSRNRYNSIFALIGILILFSFFFYIAISEEGIKGLLCGSITVAFVMYPLFFIIIILLVNRILLMPSYVIISKKKFFFQDTVVRCLTGIGGRWVNFNEIEEIYTFIPELFHEIGIKIKDEYAYSIHIPKKAKIKLLEQARKYNILITTINDNHLSRKSRFLKRHWQIPKK